MGTRKVAAEAFATLHVDGRVRASWPAGRSQFPLPGCVRVGSLSASQPSLCVVQSYPFRAAAPHFAMRPAAEICCVMLACLFGEKRVLRTFRGFLPDRGCHRLLPPETLYGASSEQPEALCLARSVSRCLIFFKKELKE